MATRARGLGLVLVVGCAACGSSAGNRADGGSGDAPVGAGDGGLDAAPDARLVDAAVAPPFTSGVSTLAGGSAAGSADGDRNTAEMSDPVNVAYGPDGKVYVTDFDNGTIRAIDAAGNVSTVIAQPNFSRPFGLAFAADGTLYTTTDRDSAGALDALSGTVWKVDIATKTATVLKGRIGRPRGMVVMPSGLLAMADDENHVIETLDPATATLTTVAGTFGAAGYVDMPGAAARFSAPYGMVVLPDGTLAVCDQLNNRIRVVNVTTGAVSTMTGTGAPGHNNGALVSASFNLPQGIAIDSAGVLYVADTGSHQVRTISGGMVSLLAGNGAPGYVDSDNRVAAEMFGLEGISVRPDGSLVYVADGNGGESAQPFNRVRQIAN